MLKTLCVWAAIVTTTFSAVAQTPNFDVKVRIGIADITEGKKICLTVPTQDLAVGT